MFIQAEIDVYPEKKTLKEMIKVYGEGNQRPLTGAHETASIEKFPYGVADIGESVKIPIESRKYADIAKIVDQSAT